MPDNPFTRELSVTILELVPVRGQLPDCHAVLRDGVTRCGFKAKHLIDNRPLCGVHCRPGVLFFPERLIPLDERISLQPGENSRQRHIK